MDWYPGDLTWAEVDPARRLSPDRTTAVRLVVDALMETERGDKSWREFAYAKINEKFVHAWGPWTCGWSWAKNGGGVIGAWCCTSHSLCPKGGEHDDVDETAARAADALFEWHEWHVRLARLFAQLDVVGRADVDAHALATAAARIVDVVVEQTEAEDAWYASCAQVLGWFLEHQGVHAKDAGVLIESAIGGRFASWTMPEDNVRHDVATTVGAAAAGALKASGASGASGASDGGDT